MNRTGPWPAPLLQFGGTTVDCVPHEVLFDPSAPPEETLRALDDLVTASASMTA